MLSRLRHVRTLDFPNTLFGIERESLTMDRLTRSYVELFGRHRNVRPLD